MSYKQALSGSLGRMDHLPIRHDFFAAPGIAQGFFYDNIHVASHDGHQFIADIHEIPKVPGRPDPVEDSRS